MTLNLGTAPPWGRRGSPARERPMGELGYGVYGIRANAKGQTGIGPPLQVGCRKGYLTAPAITPDTNCRWNAKNTSSGITMEMNAPGARTSTLSAKARIWVCRATVIGWLSASVNTRAISMSFHTQRNWKMPRLAIA